MTFLDSVIVIYFIDQPPHWGSLAAARLLAAAGQSEPLVVSDLVRMECRTHPIKRQDIARLALFDAFFALTTLRVLPISAAVCDRAAEIRATYGFKPLDALHLATAVEFGCLRFLTNDLRLAPFADLTLEVLS